MKCSVLQPSLLAALESASKGHPRRSTMLPITGHVLLTAKGNVLYLKTFNFEVGVTTALGSKIVTEGQATLPFNQFFELISLLPPERLDLELNPETLTTKIKCGRNTSNIKGLDPVEFTIIPEVTGESFQLSFSFLRTIAKKVGICAASDLSRLVLSCVHLVIDKDTLTAWAGDGFKMAKGVGEVKREEDFANGHLELNIPAKTINDVYQIAVLDGLEDDDMITVIVGKENVLLETGLSTVFCSTVSGGFPDFPCVFRASSPTIVTVGCKDMKETLAATLVFSKDSGNLAVLNIAGGENGKGKLEVIGRSQATGTSNTLTQATVETKAGLSLGVNGKYALDCIKALDSPQTILAFDGPTKAIIIHGAPETEVAYAIMPMYKDR